MRVERRSGDPYDQDQTKDNVGSEVLLNVVVLVIFVAELVVSLEMFEQMLVDGAVDSLPIPKSFDELIEVRRLRDKTSAHVVSILIGDCWTKNL